MPNVSTSTSTGAQTPTQITHGFSLNGGHLAWAILAGKKPPKRIENRKFRIAPGWYAVCCTKVCHTGVADDKWYRERYPDYPGFQTFYSWKGCIVGAAYVSHNLPHEKCKDDPFASDAYPIKNIITKVINLDVSIPCRGNFGTWPLSDEAKEQLGIEIGKHLQTNSIVETGAELVYPRDLDWETKTKVKLEDYGQASAVPGKKKKNKNKVALQLPSKAFPTPILKTIFKSKLVVPGQAAASSSNAPIPVPAAQQVVAQSSIVKNNADIRCFFGK